MRDDFPHATKIGLAMGTGLTCSNPSCRMFTGGPDSSIGVAAHITGASALGPRYDAALTVQQRKAGSNGIWLCQACAKLVDSSSCDQEYPRALLELWKQVAENRDDDADQHEQHDPPNTVACSKCQPHKTTISCSRHFQASRISTQRR